MALCLCGCGAEVKNRYVFNHHGRRAPFDYVVENAGYHTPCWLWQLGRNKWGYAKVKRDGVTLPGHRYYYELHKGPIPDGMDLDHLCRVRHCVNPDHLEPVTPTENKRRGRVTKITQEQVKAIPDRYMAGESQLQIARSLGIRQPQVSRILRAQRWAGVSVLVETRPFPTQKAG